MEKVKRSFGQVSCLILILCMSLGSVLASPAGWHAPMNQGIQASSSSSSSSSQSTGGALIFTNSTDLTGSTIASTNDAQAADGVIAPSRLVKELKYHTTAGKNGPLGLGDSQYNVHGEDDQRIGEAVFDTILSCVGPHAEFTAVVSAARTECPSLVGAMTLAQQEMRNAQEEIRKLMDPLNLVLVENGAFRFTARGGQPSIEVIDKDFYIPGDSDITQEQVDQIAGAGTGARAMREFAGLGRPMGGWSMDEWDTNYINPWNAKIEQFWSKAYPGQPMPVMDWPEAKELRYAGTKPVPSAEEETVQVDGKAVALTGLQTRHSGTDSEDPVEIARFVEYEKRWEDGPSAGGAAEANERGIKNLNGHMWKRTKTLAPGNTPARVMVGGAWNSIREGCDSSFVGLVRPELALQYVGFRPVIRYLSVL